MSQETLIVANPDIMMGKPVIAGTRITVELILDKLAAGETTEQILNDYPQLSKDSLQAVFRYAADTLRNDVVYPVIQHIS